MKTKKTGIALAILGLAVGFAAVSTTLYINGTATIKANTDDFKNNVKFTAASLDGTDISSTAISSDGKTLTFSTPEFDTIGDSSELTYEITNSSNYKAQFGTPAVTCAAVSSTTDYATYLTVTTGNELDGILLDRNGSDTDTLTVTMKQSYKEETAKTITYQCTINVDAVEATN